MLLYAFAFITHVVRLTLRNDALRLDTRSSTLPSGVEDIYIGALISLLVTGRLFPKYRSDWQELDYILIRHPLLFTMLGLGLGYASTANIQTWEKNNSSMISDQLMGL